jgi:hypothetical protein
VAVHCCGTDARTGRCGHDVIGVHLDGGGNQPTTTRKEPAHYWFDRRHVEQFDVRVQSFRIIEGEVLTLIRLLDPRMSEIYG